MVTNGDFLTTIHERLFKKIQQTASTNLTRAKKNIDAIIVPVNDIQHIFIGSQLRNLYVITLV